MKRFLLLISFFIVFISGIQAQCNIVAKRTACKNDLVGFSITNGSGAISSYDWNFGAAGTSTNAAPTVKFTIAGTVVVKCTLTLAGGGTCIDTHKITVLSLPVAKSAVDLASDTCLASNQVCVKNLFVKGTKNFETINILWGDGDITTKGMPFTARWCHTYADTGTYSLDLELKDSGGCLAYSKLKVKVVPSVKVGFGTGQTFACDSTLLCYYGTAVGGKQIKNFWLHAGTLQLVSNGSSYCAKAMRGTSLSFYYVAVNEFGCRDSVLINQTAPDSIIHFPPISNRRYCDRTLGENPITLIPNITGNWFYNGKNFGTPLWLTISNGKPGWNKIVVKSYAPCPSQQEDSIWISVIRAHAQVYNELHRNANDTVFLLDISKNPPGSRMSRTWSFYDTTPGLSQDTTWTLKNWHTGENTNYSKDSLSRHWYASQDCPLVQLSVFDSSTGCFQDTVFQVYLKPFCTPFIRKSTVCLGEPVNIDLSQGYYRLIKKKNWVFPDMGNTKDTFKLSGEASEYFYKTRGFKSPVFWRYLPADTVWTEQGGKMVIKTIRPGQGWVADTFRNIVEVLYRPNPEFKIKKISTCNPTVLQINFKDSFWLYPQEMHIDWGDDSMQDFSGYEDTIAPLDSMRHTYKKPGHYTIIVRLTPKNGCTHTMVDDYTLGYDARFGVPADCKGKVCFVDTVVERGEKKVWTAQNGMGTLSWDYGDGTFGSGFGACHTWKKAGTYTVTLVVRSKEGCTDTARRKVLIGLAHAGIKFQPTVYCKELRKYTDSSWSEGVFDSAQIVKYRWDFGDGSAPVFVRNPSHIFSGGGTYNVRHVIYTNRGCTDTAWSSVKVMGPNVKARIFGDTIGCAPFNAEFQNLSTNTGNFIWYFGDPNNTFYSTKQDTNVRFRYLKPGVYDVHITGGDSFYNPNTGTKFFCTTTYPDSTGKPLRIRVTQGYDAELLAPDTVCTYDVFEIKNLSDTIFTKYCWWKFGNGDSALTTRSNVKYQYPQAGNYKITMHAFVPGKPNVPCMDTAYANITVYDYVPDFITDCSAGEDGKYHFKKIGGPDNVSYQWTWYQAPDSLRHYMGSAGNLDYRFNFDSSLFRTICFRMTAGQYCAAETCKEIRLLNNLTLANVFTPGTHDGLNDTYKVPFYGYDLFELRIYNRWGELVFQTKDPMMEWNGKVQNTGSELPAGTYFYELKYKDMCGTKKLKKIHGSINLIR